MVGTHLRDPWREAQSSPKCSSRGAQAGCAPDGTRVLWSRRADGSSPVESDGWAPVRATLRPLVSSSPTLSTCFPLDSPRTVCISPSLSIASAACGPGSRRRGRAARKRPRAEFAGEPLWRLEPLRVGVARDRLSRRAAPGPGIGRIGRQCDVSAGTFRSGHSYFRWAGGRGRARACIACGLAA